MIQSGLRDKKTYGCDGRLFRKWVHPCVSSGLYSRYPELSGFVRKESSSAAVVQASCSFHVVGVHAICLLHPAAKRGVSTNRVG